MERLLFLWILLFNCTQVSLKDLGADVRTCEVLILGGGMAGVAAAKTLTDHGIHDFVMVEGGDQLGGRVKSAAFGGQNVELGANWVHFAKMGGNVYNPVWEMVKEAGLEYVDDDYQDYVYRENGQDVTSEADAIYERFESSLSATIKFANLRQVFRQVDIDFRDAFFLNHWEPKTPLEKAVEFSDFNFELGSEPEESSLEYNAEAFVMPEISDKFIKDSRGYSHIIRNMADKIPLVERENLFLSSYVNEIRYNESSDYKIQVTAFENKNNTKSESRFKIFKSKWAITTFSLGVLQSKDISFFPPLPKRKLDTINNCVMVNYTKIFLSFNKNVTQFWDDNHYILYVDPNQRSQYQTWQNLEARGKYFPERSNLLLVTIIGKDWERMAKLSKSQIMEELTGVLRNMYGKQAAAPEDILISDWQANKLTYGAYMHWPVGVSAEDFENMGAPVGQLYFAGEGYHYLNGYLHGAYLSGRDAALNIFNCMTRRQGDGDC